MSDPNRDAANELGFIGGLGNGDRRSAVAYASVDAFGRQGPAPPWDIQQGARRSPRLLAGCGFGGSAPAALGRDDDDDDDDDDDSAAPATRSRKRALEELGGSDDSDYEGPRASVRTEATRVSTRDTKKRKFLHEDKKSWTATVLVKGTCEMIKQDKTCGNLLGRQGRHFCSRCSKYACPECASSQYLNGVLPRAQAGATFHCPMCEPGQDKGDSTSLQREFSARAFRKSIHASRPFREMIARPKISQNEWKTAEI